MESLIDVKANKYSTDTYIVQKSNNISEVLVLENDSENRIIKMIFLSQCEDMPIGVPVWLSYVQAEYFTIIKKGKLDVPGGEVPIYS